MIAVLMIIAGALMTVFGFIFLLFVIVSPVFAKARSISGRGDPTEKLIKVISSVYGKGSLAENVLKKENHQNRKDLLRLSAGILLFGLLLFGAGYYLGYADRGNGHWFYKLVYHQSDPVPEWDKITTDGRYTADNGKEYSFYLLVKGSEYEFCGEKCADINEVREKLMSIRRENTVMLLDSYAVSSYYHEAEDLLKELAIEYETEEV